jgi:hypothetical protein
MIFYWEPVRRYYHTPLFSFSSILLTIGWLSTLAVPFIIAYFTPGIIRFTAFYYLTTLIIHRVLVTTNNTTEISLCLIQKSSDCRTARSSRWIESSPTANLSHLVQYSCLQSTSIIHSSTNNHTGTEVLIPP